jgi:molybdopterin biosynthesis enzyme
MQNLLILCAEKAFTVVQLRYNAMFMGANVKRVKMTGTVESNQAIARLTPIADVLAMIDAQAKPVVPREVDVVDAAHFVLAADVTGALRPPRATALQDGFAVSAEATADGGSYAPVRLAKMPMRIESGDHLPQGTDAVAPIDIVAMRGGFAEAVSVVAPGEGVLAAGGDVDPSKPLRETGEHIRDTDIAVFLAADIARVSVRAPHVRIVTAREDLRLMPAVQLISRDCERQGGRPLIHNGADLGDILGAADDALIVVGGTGTGARDRSVAALARRGRVAVHGIGLSPGETAAFGEAAGRPVLIVPGRLDAALAGWLVLGRRLLARLAGGKDIEPAATAKLARKVASTVGLAEVVPVRRNGEGVEPLATKYLPLSSLARSDGWILVPADSEGYPAGTPVQVRPWP